MSIYNFAPIPIAATTSSVRSALLEPGLYRITSDTDCTFLQGGSGVVALTSSNPLWSKSYLPLRVTSAADGYVAAIHASATAAVRIIRVPE